MGEYVGLVHGAFAPRPDGMAVIGTPGLKRPVAIFRGVRRPMHYLHTGNGDEVLVYVTNPRHTYRYPLRDKFTGRGPVIEPKPLDAVFTTFVSLDPDHIDGAVQSVSEAEGVGF